MPRTGAGGLSSSSVSSSPLQSAQLSSHAAASGGSRSRRIIIRMRLEWHDWRPLVMYLSLSMPPNRFSRSHKSIRWLNYFNFWLNWDSESGRRLTPIKWHFKGGNEASQFWLFILGICRNYIAIVSVFQRRGNSHSNGQQIVQFNFTLRGRWKLILWKSPVGFLKLTNRNWNYLASLVVGRKKWFL